MQATYTKQPTFSSEIIVVIVYYNNTILETGYYMVIITTPTQPHTCSALSFSQGWDISLDGPSIISLFASGQQIRSSRFLCAVGLHGMQ